jgi:hypothetical protein
MALILSANGRDAEELKVNDITLESIQRAVEGIVEPIRVAGGKKLLYVNEEGRMLGLPFNSDASSLAGRTIVGNAVLMTVEENDEWNAKEER